LALQLGASYVAASIVPIRPSEITVEGLSGTISDVNLKLNGYSHPFADDVAVQVVLFCTLEMRLSVAGAFA
jgi:hypothetical protein